MGIIKDVKRDSAAKDAARALREGRTVFLYKYVIGISSSFSEPIGGAAEVIEGIEQQGWALQQVAYDSQQGRHGSVLLLFRRDRQATPPSKPQHDDRMPMPSPEWVRQQQLEEDKRMPQPSPEWVQQHPGHPQQPGLGQLARESPPR